MSTRKFLSQIDLASVGTLNSVDTGYIGFNAKNDGLYQRMYNASDLRLLTTSDLSAVITGGTIQGEIPYWDISLGKYRPSNQLIWNNTTLTVAGNIRGNGITGTTVCASTCFIGSGAGLTGTASSLTVGCATNATTANDSTCLGGCLASYYAPVTISGTSSSFASFNSGTQILNISQSGINYWTKSGNNLCYTGGNIGVCKSSPTQALDICGKIGVNGSVAINFPTGLTGTMIFGNGNTPVNSTGSEGYYNTFVGYNVSRINSKGYCNTFVGYNSGCNVTTGALNTFIGTQVACSNTCGSNNTFVGSSSGLQNITGCGNVFLGGLAGGFNCTGCNNIAVGSQAGLYDSGGNANDVSCTSVYLGADTRSNAYGDVNEIVIGYCAYGKGSNSVILGNTSITATTLQGNVRTTGTLRSAAFTGTTVCASTCFVGSGAGLTGTASSLTVGCATSASNSACLGGCLASCYQTVANSLSMTNGVDNRIVTATGVLGLNGESKLLYDGTNLTITGNTIYNAIPPVGDHTTSGDLLILTAHENVAIGDVVFINASGEAQLCKADVIANAPYCTAICADATITANASGKFLLKGTIRDDSWSWTVGGLIYVSITGTTGNTLTQTAPSAANNVIMAIGFALSATVIYFFGNVIPIEHV